MKLALAALALALAGCSVDHVITTKTVNGTAVDHGAALFAEPAAASAFSCATCHLAAPDPSSHRLLPGAPLAGVVERPLFWGGQENDLLRSINDCRRQFMGAPDPWSSNDPDAQAVYAYLESFPAAETKLWPFTVVPTAADLAPGDAAIGADVFTRACQSCHGALHTGEGRLTPSALRLPDDAVAAHASASAADRRAIFVEKIRHGSFLGLEGSMPPFSEEALSDDQIAGVLAYFQLYP